MRRSDLTSAAAPTDPCPRPKVWPLWGSELVGTALLVAVGCSFVVLDFGAGSPVAALVPGAGVRRALTGFLFGSAGALIAVSPVGKVSGAHLNPAVTFAFWLMRCGPCAPSRGTRRLDLSREAVFADLGVERALRDAQPPRRARQVPALGVTAARIVSASASPRPGASLVGEAREVVLVAPNSYSAVKLLSRSDVVVHRGVPGRVEVGRQDAVRR